MPTNFSNVIPLRSTSPVAIFPDGWQEGLTIRNTGNDVAYIGGSPTVSEANGFPLGSNSSMSWDAQRPLWALGSSSSSQVLVFANTGNLFDASAIAGEILAQGLATDIATEISIYGAPSINRSTVVDLSYQIPAFNVMPPVTYVDSSQSHTLNLYVNEKYAVGAPPVPYTDNARTYTITWFNELLEPIAVDGLASMPAQDLSLTLKSTLATIPVRGPRFTLTFSPIDTDSSTKPYLTIYATLSLVESSEIVVEQGLQLAGQDTSHVTFSGGGGVGVYHAGLTVSSVYPATVDYPSFRSGMGTVALHSDGMPSGVSVTLNLVDRISRSGFFQHTFTSPDDEKITTNIMLPRVPLSMNASLTGATSGITVSYTILSP